MKTGRITLEHQVTVPEDVRAALDLNAGDEVSFEIRDGTVTIVKCDKAKLAEQWIAENLDAMNSWNEWIEKNGLPLAKYRQF